MKANESRRKEMMTSGGEREERRAWTHDNMYVALLSIFDLN